MADGSGYFPLGAGAQNELSYPKFATHREGRAATRSQSGPEIAQRHRSGAGRLHAKSRGRMPSQLALWPIADGPRHDLV